MIDVVYPKICAGCGSRGAWLCTWCDSTVPVLAPPHCERCGMPAMTGFACWCGNMTTAWDKARSVYPYHGWAGAAVRRVKYAGEFDRAQHLAAMMAPLVADFGRIDGLVPVPLHESRLADRGFNQSELLAQHLAEASGIPVKPMLVRVERTEAQARLSLDARRRNVRDAFALSEEWTPVPAERLLLIDDVRTSGATLNACVETLVLASAGSVSALTFALDMRPRELEAFMRREGH